MKVTEFINFNQVMAQLPVSAVLDAIKNGRCKPQVQVLRKLLADGNEAEYKKQKRYLPAFTPSATFEGGRKPENLLQYSGLIILDIDKLPFDEIDAIFGQALKIPFTFACFRSPSNSGLKILVQTDSDQANHAKTFEAVKSHYETILQFTVDPSGKDITRLCFFSWDPSIHINTNSKIFKTSQPSCLAELIESRHSNDTNTSVVEALETTSPPVAEALEATPLLNAEPLVVPDLALLTSQIESRNIDITDNYKSWLNIGFALADALGESGRDYFHRISRLSSLYNAADCDTQFKNCLKSKRKGITIKTLFFLAKEHGIDVSQFKTNSQDATLVNDTEKPKQEKEKEKKRSNLFDKIEKFLLVYYSLRYNVVTGKIEIKPKGAQFYEPITDYIENSIYRQLHKSNILVSMAKLRSILQSDFCERYDPFLDYFSKLPPHDNQTDFIQQLAETVETTDNTFWHYCFKKWIVAVVASLLDPAVVNHTAIIFSGAQGIGKTTWMENLCPRELRPYLFSGTINPNNKDTLVHLTECMFINMDELENMNRTEIGTLKEIITKSAIRIRRSYGHNNESLTRRASFMGSVNTSQFLNDTTGSRRFLCFEAISIQYNPTVNIQSVYAQAMALWQSGFQFYFDKEEVRQISDNNEKYQIRTAEEELLLTWFLPCETSLATNFYSASQILAKLSTRGCINTSTGNVISLGKALKKHGFQKIKKQGLYVYAVKELDFNQVDANSRAHPDEPPF